MTQSSKHRITQSPNYPISYIFPLLILFAAICLLLATGCVGNKPSQTAPAGADAGKVSIPYPALSIEKESANVDDAEKNKGDKKSEFTETAHPSYETLKSYETGQTEVSKSAKPEEVTFDRTKMVQISIEDMPLLDFINFFFGKLMGVNYVFGERIGTFSKRKISINLNREMSLENVYDMVVKLLEGYHVEIQYEKGVFFIGRKAGNKPPPGINAFSMGRESTPEVEGSTEVAQIVPIYYMSEQLDDLKNVLNILGSSAVSISQGRKGQFLILKGPRDEVQSVLDLIRLLDRPLFSNRMIGFYRLTYWNPEDFIVKINQLLSAEGIETNSEISATGLCFIPVIRLRAVICFSPDKTVLSRVLYWKNILDVPGTVETDESFFVYFPRHARAQELGETLTRILAMDKEGPPGPVDEQLREETPKGGQKSGEKKVSEKAVGKKISPGIKASVRSAYVVVDENRNALILYCSANRYKTILDLLGQIDIMPKQVLIEVTVAEVTLKDDLQYGVEWYLKNPGNITGTLSTLGGLALPAGGLSYSLISSTQNFQAMLTMLAKKTNIRILSTPHLTVRDNEAANIKIGQDVPVLVSATTSDIQQEGSTQIIQSVQYRATGVMLEVTPTINSQEMVTLDISQEVSEAQTNTISKVDSPLILDRSVQTKVVSKHGQSILLGGIISDTLSETTNKVPFLGDIPILGFLFKTKSTGRVKSEVIILVTPHIITNEKDIDTVRREILGRMHLLDEEQTGRYAR